MSIHAITDLVARRHLSSQDYADLELGEAPTLWQVQQHWTEYDTAAEATSALSQTGGWLVDDDGNTTWIPAADDLWAAVADITPSRATVLALGDEEDLVAEYEDRHDVAIVRVQSGVSAGDRVWRGDDIWTLP